MSFLSFISVLLFIYLIYYVLMIVIDLVFNKNKKSAGMLPNSSRHSVQYEFSQPQKVNDVSNINREAIPQPLPLKKELLYGDNSSAYDSGVNILFSLGLETMDEFNGFEATEENLSNYLKNG